MNATELNELELEITAQEQLLEYLKEQRKMAQIEKRDNELRDGDARITLMDSTAFRLATPKHFGERPYVLPFGGPKWNVRDVENAEFGKSWLAGMTAIVCRRLDQDRTRPTRVIFTSGRDLGDTNKIGAQFLARHDQTNAKLGEYEVAGLVFYDRQGNVLRMEGDVPDVKMAISTYK